ncbi:MAG: ThuA domain-containing protein [Microscillaceae bacterium]|nr:ThuA domain-containing protein [Microscillaceae bacterium]
MKKILKILLWSILSLVFLAVLFVAGFIYKVTYGFPVYYETKAPKIDFPEGRIKKVLLFSKVTGYNHGESIKAAKKVFADLAKKNAWFLYESEEGGVFNPEQLAKFNTVIFNNCTGRLLNKTQQKALEVYIQQGGSFIGIHGAGDNSHHWDWYEQELIGVRFSHHPIKQQFQEAIITRNPLPDSLLLQRLPETWTHTDEWYVFYENPRDKGFQVIYAIDGEKIEPNGNLLWITSKNFGMGKDHPVAWYRAVGKGRTFYTSIGHDARSWQQKPFVQMFENAINSWGR